VIYWKTSALNKSLKELQAAWYERLEREGFQDAEEIVGEEIVLRQIAEHPYRHTDDLMRSSKEAYFRFLTHQIQDERFSNEIDRLIMTLFADGMKIKPIIEALHQRGVSRCRGTIRFTIRKYEMRWGLREYTLKQLNKKEAS
jgi:hypothetical protein